jgi:hypothetical protein
MNTMSRIVFSCVVSIAFLASSLPSTACPQPPGYGYIIHSEGCYALFLCHFVSNIRD